MFNVVKFTDTDEVEVVSSSWLQEGEEGELCFWPQNFKSQKLKKALLDGQEPDGNWIMYNVTVLGTYDTYDKARQKLKLAEDTSNLDTDDGTDKTKRRCFGQRKRQFSDSSGSECEDQKIMSKKANKLPLPPPINHSISHTEHASKQFMHPKDANATVSTSYQSQGIIGNRYSIVSTGNSQQHIAAVSSLPGMSSDTSPMSRHWSRYHNATPAEKHLFRMMDDMKKVQDEHTCLLKNLINLCSNLNRTDTSSSSVSLPFLPLKSSSDLEEWEAFLDVPTNFKQALQHVAGKGGLTVGEATRRIMSFIFTHNLACQLNWAGRGEKSAFKEMKTKMLVVCAVKESKVLNVNEKDVEAAIKNWLKYAPMRVKYREEIKKNNFAGV